MTRPIKNHSLCLLYSSFASESPKVYISWFFYTEHYSQIKAPQCPDIISYWEKKQYGKKKTKNKNKKKNKNKNKNKTNKQKQKQKQNKQTNKRGKCQLGGRGLVNFSVQGHNSLPAMQNQALFNITNQIRWNKAVNYTMCNYMSPPNLTINKVSNETINWTENSR